MRQERIILLLVAVVVLLLMLLITGVGYAVETDNILISDNAVLSPEQSDFKVVFFGEPTYTGNGIAMLKLTGPTTATINITGLKNIGDSVTAIFTIANKSSYIYADIYADVTNTNTEYFNVTSTLSTSKINPKTENTILRITIELIKLPTDNEQHANICTNILATPRYY